jgi:cyclopropane fatty-acyl-phospholipid synthase-like methyltransferase
LNHFHGKNCFFEKIDLTIQKTGALLLTEYWRKRPSKAEDRWKTVKIWPNVWPIFQNRIDQSFFKKLYSVSFENQTLTAKYAKSKSLARFLQI